MWLTSVKLQIYEQMNNSRIFLCFTGFQCYAKNIPNSVSSIHICPDSESAACQLDSTNTMLHCSLCPNSMLTKSTCFSEVCASMLSFTLQERLIRASLFKSYLPDIYFAPFPFFRLLVRFPDPHCIILSSHYL